MQLETQNEIENMHLQIYKFENKAKKKKEKFKNIISSLCIIVPILFGLFFNLFFFVVNFAIILCLSNEQQSERLLYYVFSMFYLL